MGSDWIASDAPDDPLDELYLRGYEEMARSISDASVANVIRLLVSGVRQGQAVERERDAYRAALQSIADFRPKSEQPAWGGPYEQIAAYAKERARGALCAGAPAAGGEAAGQTKGDS